MTKLLITVFLVFSLVGCATTLSTLQRRGIESRNLEGSFDDAFKATLQVFQDQFSHQSNLALLQIEFFHWKIPVTP